MLKRKEKEDLVLIGKLKSVLSKLRNLVSAKMKIAIDDTFLIEMIPFAENDVINIKSAFITKNERKEDVFLEEIAENIINCENVFMLDPIIEKKFTYKLLNSDETEFTDFIEIPICKQPPMHILTYEQINFTRDNMKEGLKPFKNDLHQLAEQLLSIPYLPENMNQITQLCNNKLALYQKSIQEQIDDSIYLNNVKSKVGDDFFLTLTIGIASAETIVDFYEKTKVIEPYMASEIKQRVSRHFNLKSTYLFIYYKFNHGKKRIHLLNRDIEL